MSPNKRKWDNCDCPNGVRKNSLLARAPRLTCPIHLPLQAWISSYPAKPSVVPSAQPDSWSEGAMFLQELVLRTVYWKVCCGPKKVSQKQNLQCKRSDVWSLSPDKSSIFRRPSLPNQLQFWVCSRAGSSSVWTHLWLERWRRPCRGRQGWRRRTYSARCPTCARPRSTGTLRDMERVQNVLTDTQPVDWQISCPTGFFSDLEGKESLQGTRHQMKVQNCDTPFSKTEIRETFLAMGSPFLNHWTVGVGSPMATHDNTNVTPDVTCVSSRGRTKICGVTPAEKPQGFVSRVDRSNNGSFFSLASWRCRNLTPEWQVPPGGVCGFADLRFVPLATMLPPENWSSNTLTACIFRGPVHVFCRCCLHGLDGHPLDRPTNLVIQICTTCSAGFARSKH